MKTFLRICPITKNIYFKSSFFNEFLSNFLIQIRDIVHAAGQVEASYRKQMDITFWYMQSINLPKEMQARVRNWFNYNWEQQKTLGENIKICIFY